MLDDILAAIVRAQAGFLAEPLDRSALSAALHDLVRFSQSEYGLVTEVVPQSKGYLYDVATASIACEHGVIESLRPMFHSILLDALPLRAPVRVNKIPPLQTSALQRYFILPLHHQELVGFLVLANSPTAYTQKQAQQWQALLDTLASLLVFQRRLIERAAVNVRLERQQAALLAFQQVAALNMPDEQTLLSAALQIGCDYLGLPIGLYCHICDGVCKIVAQQAINADYSIGQTFPVTESYCSFTLAAKDVFAVSMMGLSQWAEHACYARFEWESYIGVALEQQGDSQATLSFASINTHSHAFDDIETEFIRLLANWLSAQLARRRSLDERNAVFDRFQKISDQVPGLVFQSRINQDGTSAYLYASAGIEAIYGLSAADVANDASVVLAAVHPDDVDAVIASYTKAQQELSRWDTVYRVNHPQKGLIWLEGHATPERTPEGDTLWYGMVMDVSERKHAEALLIEAKMAAEAANHAKSLFLANMSHEIRTPMNGVLGMTALLFDTELTPLQRDYLSTVKVSGDALLGVINDILDFSKIEAGRLELEQIDFDLPQLLKDFSAMMSVRLHEKGLTYQCRIANDVPKMVSGDPGRLRQVLINLVGNAIKFTEAGEVAVHLSLASKSNDTLTLRCCVSDSGMGIPSDKIHRLFNSFSQVDETMSRRFGGTGLGLAICKQIVTLMHGDISVHSVAGQGTDFVFTVQLAMCDTPLRPRTSLNTQPAAQKVLLVDAIETHRETLSALLQPWAGQLDCVDSSALALQALHAAAELQQPYTMVVVDMHLPQIDGLVLGRTIKAKPQLADPFLVLLTAIGVRGDGGRARQAGFAAYLNLPVQGEEFLAILALVLQGEGTNQLVTRYTLREISAAPCRVLLVEDNPVNRIVGVKILEKLGCSVVTAENGHYALLALIENEFDLILMDMQMPEMDGLEATRLIRSQSSGSHCPNIPIIALTANAMADDKQRCLDAGMNDFLVKPIQIEALGAAIKQWATK